MGSFDDGLANVSRVEYLGPQPVLPAVALDSEERNPENLLSSRRTIVSFQPWTVGAGKHVFASTMQDPSPSSHVTHTAFKFQL